MRWTPGGRSQDIEDRRGQGGFPIGKAGAGLGGIVVLILSLLFGGDIFSGGGTGGAGTAPYPGDATAGGEVAPARSSPEEEKMVQFVSFVLDDAQQTWSQILPRYGTPYRHAKLVLYRGVTQSGCGIAQSATGPFYCPMDEKVYVDLSFFDELQQRFGAPGDFAEAYVLAHELGHHVQKLLGTEAQVRRQQQLHPDLQNALSVRLELQADCYAGIWGHATEQRQLLDPGDIQEGLNAAAAVGDDRLQRMTRGTVVPESFTHGSSAQRESWFRRGFESGKLEACDTFAGR